LPQELFRRIQLAKIWTVLTPFSMRGEQRTTIDHVTEATLYDMGLLEFLIIRPEVPFSGILSVSGLVEAVLRLGYSNGSLWSFDFPCFSNVRAEMRGAAFGSRRKVTRIGRVSAARQWIFQTFSWFEPKRLQGDRILCYWPTGSLQAPLERWRRHPRRRTATR